MGIRNVFLWMEILQERDEGEGCFRRDCSRSKVLGWTRGDETHARRWALDQFTHCNRKEGRGAWVPPGLIEGVGGRALGRVLVFSDEIRRKVINRVRRWESIGDGGQRGGCARGILGVAKWRAREPGLMSGTESTLTFVVLNLEKTVLTEWFFLLPCSLTQVQAKGP